MSTTMSPFSATAGCMPVGSPTKAKLTGGNPGKLSELLALNIFNTMYSTQGWQGVGQAKAVIFFILVAIISLIQNKMSRSKEVEQ